jgi:hypothetical protein
LVRRISSLNRDQYSHRLPAGATKKSWLAFPPPGRNRLDETRAGAIGLTASPPDLPKSEQPKSAPIEGNSGAEGARVRVDEKQTKANEPLSTRLTWDRVYLDRDRALINRSLSVRYGITTPKTKSSRRMIRYGAHPVPTRPETGTEASS